MTATERLRELLDERGVEWAEYGYGYTEFCTRTVVDGERYYIDVRHYTVQPNVVGSLIVTGLTPEQAIEATLGRGTCHITDNGPWGYPYVCSACGASFDPDVNNGEFNYCPNCGRKVADK